MLSSGAVKQATIIGTVLQLAMVITGHFVPAVAQLFAPVGMAISLIAGVIYARGANERSFGSLAVGGMTAGGVCAFIGIAVSCLLGDVEPMILALGTVSSAVSG